MRFKGKIMIHVLILIFLFHNEDASIQFFKDIWSKTKICIGEGGYCPLNLPLKFPGCCKPYVCKMVKKTCNPTLFARLTEFTNNRCMLPLNSTHPNHMATEKESITPSLNIKLASDFKNITEPFHSLGKIYEIGGNEIIEQYTGFQYKDYNSNVSLSKENYSNNEIFKDNNEQNGMRTIPQKPHNKVILKRSIPVTYADGRNNSEETEQIKALVNGTEYSGEHHASSPDYSESGYSEESNSTDYNSEYEENNSTSTTVKYVDNLYMELNQTNNSTAIEDDPSINNKLDNITTLQNISAEEIDEDWTSSEMVFDKRPTLGKVVTILPYHFFSSVEVARINETIETSE